MDLPTLRRTIARSQDFLRSRKAVLYGDRPVRFEPGSTYAESDRMLRRRIAYMSFDVLERIAEGRIKIAGSGFEVTVLHGSLPKPKEAGSAPESFGTFLVRRMRPSQAASRDFLLTLPSFEDEVRLLKSGPGEFRLMSTSMTPGPFASYATLLSRPESLEAELLAWLREALGDWTSGVADLRLLGRQAGDLEESPAIGAWRLFSRIDVDASGEETPHVFRWREANRSFSSRYAELTEAECRSILGAEGASVPSEARLAGIFRDELPDDAECLALRYVHEMPDPAVADPDPSVPWRSRGGIVVEGDYWEFQIDAATRTLVGESRKWRPVASPLS